MENSRFYSRGWKVKNVKKKFQSIRNVTLIGQLGDIIAYKQGLWTVIVPASSHCSALQGMSTLSEEELWWMIRKKKSRLTKKLKHNAIVMVWIYTLGDIEITEIRAKKITSGAALYCNGWLYSHRKQGKSTEPLTGAVRFNFFKSRFLPPELKVRVFRGVNKIIFRLSNPRILTFFRAWKGC